MITVSDADFESLLGYLGAYLTERQGKAETTLRQFNYERKGRILLRKLTKRLQRHKP